MTVKIYLGSMSPKYKDQEEDILMRVRRLFPRAEREGRLMIGPIGAFGSLEALVIY